MQMSHKPKKMWACEVYISYSAITSHLSENDTHFNNVTLQSNAVWRHLLKSTSTNQKEFSKSLFVEERVKYPSQYNSSKAEQVNVGYKV